MGCGGVGEDLYHLKEKTEAKVALVWTDPAVLWGRPGLPLFSAMIRYPHSEQYGNLTV